MNEAFEGITGAKPATDMTAHKFLKVALVGKPKTGKSWTAATMPGTVLIYDFDERADSLVTLPEDIKQNIQVKTLHDQDQAKPTAFAELEADLSKLQYRKSQCKPIPDSYVFDSVTYLKQAILNQAFQTGLAFRSLRLTMTKSICVSKNWDAVNTVDAAVDYLITEYSQLGNICFIFHEKPEKDYTESTPEATAYTEQITVDPQHLAKVLSRFNEYFRIKLNSQQKYEVTCKPSAEFPGATTLLIDQVEKPNINDLLKKHRERLAKLQQPKLVSNT
jgi:hypothetical protein